MKVKLLEPVDGFEEIAEFNVEYNPRDRGEWIPHQCNRGVLSLTTKPLPVVEVPKFFGCVKIIGQTWIDAICIVTRVDRDGVSAMRRCGSVRWFPTSECKLYRTANIPTSPELEALFKEPQ